MNRTRAERCLTAAFAVGLFFLCLINFSVISSPLLLNDEIGYLGNAATLAGKDWHSVMRHLAWYSYGWSLVLAPLFRLFSSMQVILRCINVINALSVVAVFFMQRSLLKRLFRDERPFLATIASGGACCYVGVLTQAELFWSETWLMFVYTVITLLVQRLVERPSKGLLAAFGVSIYYLYVCHNRMLAVVIAAVMIVAALYARRSIGIGDVLLFAAALAVAYMAFSPIRAYVVSSNWENDVPEGNLLKGRVKALPKIGQMSSIKNLLLMIVTHGFSISVGSYGLLPLGLFLCVKRTVQLFRKKTKGSDEPLLGAWMALSFLGLLAVTTLPQMASNIPGLGYNYIFYVRYFEPVCVLLIAYGFRALAEMASKRWAGWYSAAYTCLFLAAAATVYYLCTRVLNPEYLNNDYLVKPNAGAIAAYLYYLNYRPGATLVAGLCAAIGWNAMRFLFKGKDACKMIAVAGFIAANLVALRISGGDNRAGHLYYGQDLPLVDVVQSTDMHDLPIYIVSDNDGIVRFRCWLIDTPLEYAKDVPADQIPEERYYAIVSRTAYEALGYRERDGEILGETQRHLFLYVDGQT